MTAAELPVGAQFAIAGDDLLFTVTAQVPGLATYLHITHASYYDCWNQCERIAGWAGHTEVIAVPDARATGDSTP